MNLYSLTFTFLIFTAFTTWAEVVFNDGTVAEAAIRDNPELAAARSLIAEAEARTFSTGRLSNPELVSEFAGGQDLEGRISIGLTQRFPLTARLRLERELSSLDLECARLEVKDRERQIQVAARDAFVELVAAQSLMGLARRQRVLADDFAKSIREGATEGFGSELDARQAALSADSLGVDEESRRSEVIAATARLNALLGRPADKAPKINASLDLPKVLPTPRPVGARADLELAELSLQAGAKEVSLAKASRWEDVGVGFFVEGERFRDEPGGIEPESLIGVQLTLPLPIWQNGSGKVSEKEAARARRAQQLDALRFKVRNEALAAHQIMASRYKAALVASTRLVPAALEQLTSSEAAYRRGELDIQRVFLARENLAAIESAALEAQKNYHLSYSEWLGAVGDPTPKP